MPADDPYDSQHISPDKVVVMAYNAGFRGEDLVNVVAIAKRESGYKPTAHNTNTKTGDNSYGMMQINMLGDMGPKRLNQFGLTSNDQLLDPQTNFNAAFKMYQSAGNKLTAWGGYKGLSNTYNTNVAAARFYVTQAQGAGKIGGSAADYAGSGSTGVGGAQAPYDSPAGASNVQQPSTGPVSIDLPSDARLFWTLDTSQLYAFFDVGGAVIYYTLPSDGAGVTMGGTPANLQSAVGINSAQLAQWVPGGDGRELMTVSATYGSYDKFFSSILGQVMGYNNPAANDPDVKKVLAEFAGRPDMTTAELQNKLQATQWYQTHTAGQLEWNGLSGAEQTKRVQDAHAQLMDLWQQYAGRPPEEGDPNFAMFTDYLSQGKMSLGAITEWVKRAASEDPNSAWSLELKKQAEAARQPAVDRANTAQRINDLARQWGVQLDAGKVNTWAAAIVDKTMADADVLTQIKGSAAVLYPWKDPEIETDTAASPWVQAYNTTMEKNVDLFDPKVQAALQQGQPLWKFQQELKQSPDWMKTKNAQDTISTNVANVGRLMGFS